MSISLKLMNRGPNKVHGGWIKIEEFVSGRETFIKNLRVGASAACVYGSGQEINAKRLHHAFSY